MKTKVIVTEDHTETGIDWGVSFDGNNPIEDRYFQCNTKEDAFNLADMINLYVMDSFTDKILEGMTE